MRAWAVACIRRVLSEHGQAYQFHDFKKHGVPEAALDAWLSALGWETLLNRKGSTWRALDEAAKAAVTDTHSARAVMLLPLCNVVAASAAADVTSSVPCADRRPSVLLPVLAKVALPPTVPSSS